MKFSLKSMQALSQQDDCCNNLIDDDLANLFERIGGQLGAIDSIDYIGAKYENVYVVKVVSVEPHPNADKLKVCKIDDNKAVKDAERDHKGLIQVVCGAPNVRPGILAAWLPVGSTVPETLDKEPFILEARQIRDVTSNGMLASPKELALWDSHEGILELDDSLSVGKTLAEALDIKDDAVIDLENKMFTHRPDCFGLLGIARELAGIQDKTFKSPEWYGENAQLSSSNDSLSLNFNNELGALVPRFTAICMSNISIKTSPFWLQLELIKLGLRPINNIVDLTNYLMLLTAQPLHAYDYDKVKALSSKDGASLRIRNPRPSEELTLLNGKTIKPRSEAIMIATDTTLIGLGGVMGGASTEVDDNTKNIIIECANFDMYSIRRTSMEHGIFSDAVTRFNKGQSPLQNLAVLGKMVSYIEELSGAKVASSLVDYNNLEASVIKRGSLHPSVTLELNFINERLGIELTLEQIKRLLENVEFKVEIDHDELKISAPFWRTDIELREDIVEEVGRLYGYNNLPLNLPLRDTTPVESDLALSYKAAIRSKLSEAGANEVLTYSFVHKNLFLKASQTSEEAYELSNAISPDLQFYRLSLTPSLLDKVNLNIKAGFDQFAIFEIGKSHNKADLDDDDLPAEGENTALVVASANKLGLKHSAYYQAKLYLESLCPTDLAYKPISKEVIDDPLVAPYEPKRSALVYLRQSNNLILLGIIGEFKTSVKKAFKLPNFCAGFEVDSLIVGQLVNQSTYKIMSRYPKVTQDISLKVPNQTSYQDLYDLVFQAIEQNKLEESSFTLEPLDIYQSKDDQESKHITYRISIASYHKTLTDKEVNVLLDKVASICKEKIGAERL